MMEKVKPVELVDVAELSLKGVEGVAHVERMDHYAETLEEAAEIFARDGVVSLSPNCMVDIEGDDGNTSLVSVEQLTSDTATRTIAGLQTIWDSKERDEIIRQKDYGAYNGTERHMRTVSFKNVQERFSPVIQLQHRLTPTIRQIVADPSVEVSVDEDEGTVINLQLFEKDAAADTRQEHGAHTDRVDTTVVICLDNVGPQGDFVYLKGYNDACQALGLDPHRDFPSNMTRVLSEAPDSVIFRVYKVAPGRMLVIRTDQDVHFITPKLRGDVEAGIREGAKPSMLGGKIIGRGIINAAFETDHCRAVFEDAKKIYKKYDQLTKLFDKDFFEALDAVLKTEVESGLLSVDKARDVRNACVTQKSAEQLYND